MIREQKTVLITLNLTLRVIAFPVSFKTVSTPKILQCKEKKHGRHIALRQAAKRQCGAIATEKGKDVGEPSSNPCCALETGRATLSQALKA